MSEFTHRVTVNRDLTGQIITYWDIGNSSNIWRVESKVNDSGVPVMSIPTFIPVAAIEYMLHQMGKIG